MRSVKCIPMITGGGSLRTLHHVGLALLLCSVPVSANAAPRYVATIHPIAAILSEITGDRAEVVTLLPRGGSPHTYAPRPSDVAEVAAARALFYVSHECDGWATRLPARAAVSFLDMVPESHRLTFSDTPNADSPPDPHFWLDPECVRMTLPALVEVLSEVDREGHAVYSMNAERFGVRLAALDKELRALLKPVAGKPVFLFHPSFRYLLKRYGLVLAGVVEPAPGKEPTPKSLEKLARAIRDAPSRVLFTEPQLPRRPVEVLAEAAGARIHELDPLGGGPGRRTYEELVRFNASVLREALK